MSRRLARLRSPLDESLGHCDVGLERSVFQFMTRVAFAKPVDDVTQLSIFVAQ